MYLKQIELENFKSFGGKVTVPLMDGYMAVTGPNGSGKSNIGDAILFVLGPRSPKAVRAGRITDLIFNGGSSRSRASYMKVSLVFDNKDRIMPWDDDTVTLTRYVKLNDNGVDYSSYFFINDQKSTLTEFDRLLTKARISADGYNIVQQGDVTSIVEIGAVERRKILDGISGIASFDADLQAAGAERVEVNSNLERVEFIRSEKEKTVRQLEKDRAEAMKYKEVKDRLDTATAQLTVRQRDNQKATYESIVSSLDGTEKELEELSRKKAEAIEQRDSNEKAVSEKDAEIEARLGSEYTKVKQDVEEAKIKVASEKSRADAASEDIEKQKAFREGFVQDNEENRSQRQTLTDNLSDLEIKKKDADTELSTALAEEKSIREETASHGGEMTDLQKKLEAVEKQIDAAARSEQEASSRQAAVGSVLENAKNAKDQAEQAVESARFEVKDADWNLQEIKRQAGPQNEAEELGNKILALKKQESELEKQEDELRSIADKKTAEYNRLSTEKRVTELLNSGSEALSRILTLKESGEIKGIRGTVAQLATVDPGYETAAAVAAGGKMNAVVVDNKNVGAECINYLKRNGLGRLTFLPMDEMMPGKPRAKAIMVLKRTDGYISGFVEYKPEYENVFWYVFGDTLVVGDLDKAKDVMGGVRVVTRAGELIEASGAMTGGNLDKRRIGKFGPSGQSALEAAAAEMKKAQDQLDEIRSDLRALRDKIRETDSQMTQAGSRGIGMKGKIAAADATLAQAKKGLAAAEADLAKKAQAVSDAEAQLSSADAALEEARAGLESLRDSQAKMRDRLSVIAPAGLQERIQKAGDRVFAARNAVSDLESQINSVKAEAAGLDRQKEATDEQISHVDGIIAQDEEAVRVHTANSEKLKVDLEAVKSIMEKMESAIEGLKAERDALIEKGYDLRNRAEAAQKDIEVKEGFLTSQRAQAEICRKELEQLEEAVRAITVEVAEPVPSEAALKAEIKQCNEAISALGNVNLRAIEDYDAAVAEYGQLVEQTKVLTGRITELDRLAEELSQKKKGLFMEAYDAVDANFKEIYAKLSGGGEAYMALDDPEDPFAGGLQINAKPRNGKMTRLAALSGGEKSLTALSFIFAIQEYQPSPFYVLDEVDMFLDSVNAETVAARVKESSATAQFIQVSLRQVALRHADHLIGVTRPPNGISRIIMQPDIAEVSKYEEEALRNMKKEEEGSSGTQ